MQQDETALLRLIQLEASKNQGVRLWRNESGLFFAPNGSRVRAGLCRGSSDLIGLRSILITPEMTGTKIAQFLAIEVKVPGGRITDEQAKFIDLVNVLGGYGRVIDSLAEARF